MVEQFVEPQNPGAHQQHRGTGTHRLPDQRHLLACHQCDIAAGRERDFRRSRGALERDCGGWQRDRAVVPR